MINFKRLFFCALIAFSYSCADEKSSKSDLTDIIVDPSKIQDALDIVEYVSDKFEIIPLETTDESVIAQVYKVIYQNGIYYVLDKETASILLFDAQGKYISKLSKKGQGPDEYVSLSDFVVVGSDIWILDPNLQLLIGYGNDFKQIKRRNLKDVINAEYLVSMDNMIYLAKNAKFEEKNMQLGSYDFDTDEINGLIYVPGLKLDGIVSIGKMSQLSASGGSCLFIHSYCDTIFQIKNNTVAPKYRIAFTERYRDVPYRGDELFDKYKDFIKGIHDIKQIGRFILLGYVDGEFFPVDKEPRFITAAYDSDKNIAQAYRRLTNSRLGLNIYQLATFPTDEYIISSYLPSEILENKQKFIPDMNKVKNEADRKKIEQLLAGLDAEDNPVLFKFNVK